MYVAGLAAPGTGSTGTKSEFVELLEEQKLEFEVIGRHVWEICLIRKDSAYRVKPAPSSFDIFYRMSYSTQMVTPQPQGYFGILCPRCPTQHTRNIYFATDEQITSHYHTFHGMVGEAECKQELAKANLAQAAYVGLTQTIQRICIECHKRYVRHEDLLLHMTT